MSGAATPYEALRRAAELAGGQSALARICEKAQPTVWKWLQSSKRLPAEHVLPVEAATGVSRHLLRPDIYPLEHGAMLPSLPDVSPSAPAVSCGRRRISQAVAEA
ncbi:transcriptional regulator [Sphingomonas profundi]|uniref:transcriptional regulator n=1 Tax=Alterirhizorhabdus profundi TaxID=2681549 RepID=UPI0012E8E2BB|nr:YdaS family helix-turn-helix protein [Sphingomonas profundi]